MSHVPIDVRKSYLTASWTVAMIRLAWPNVSEKMVNVTMVSEILESRGMNLKLNLLLHLYAFKIVRASSIVWMAVTIVQIRSVIARFVQFAAQNVWYDRRIT